MSSSATPLVQKTFSQYLGDGIFFIMLLPALIVGILGPALYVLFLFAATGNFDIGYGVATIVAISTIVFWALLLTKSTWSTWPGKSIVCILF